MDNPRFCSLWLADPGLADRIRALSPDWPWRRNAGPADHSDGTAPLDGRPGLLVTDMDILRGREAALRQWLEDPGRRARCMVFVRPRDRERAAPLLAAGLEHLVLLPVGDLELKALLDACRRAVEPPALEGPAAADSVILESRPMQELYARLRSVAELDALNIQLSGETGTGKQELARLVHRHSPRAAGPFVEIDCASLPAGLVESQLFGHEAGAFTDARTRNLGLFEAAQGGTLFLDEIGELPLAAQAKLLRALELRRFRRVGGREELRLDARLICATNRDLGQEVLRGRFRADLYYRISGVTLALAPLRERPEDVRTLAAFFYGRACSQFGFPAYPIGRGVLEALCGHAWPGNIRELRNLMQRMVALTPRGRPLDEGQVRAELAGVQAPSLPPPEEAVPTLRETEAGLVRRALAATGGNKTAAAKLIGVSKPTLFRKLKEFGINL